MKQHFTILQLSLPLPIHLINMSDTENNDAAQDAIAESESGDENNDSSEDDELLPLFVTIGEDTYDRATVTEITIPEGVTRIPKQSFQDCLNLIAINLPSTLTSIGSSSFYNCTSLSSLIIPESVISIGMFAFANTAIISIVLPSSETTISDGVFYKCGYLQVINLRHITSIGNSAFADCLSLASMYGNGMTKPKLNLLSSLIL